LKEILKLIKINDYFDVMMTIMMTKKHVMSDKRERERETHTLPQKDMRKKKPKNTFIFKEYFLEH